MLSLALISEHFSDLDDCKEMLVDIVLTVVAMLSQFPVLKVLDGGLLATTLFLFCTVLVSYKIN